MDTFKSKFKLKNFVVKSFSITREPGKQGTADLDLKPYAIHNPAKRHFQLILEIKLKDKQSSYQIDMLAMGNFEFQKGLEQKELTGYFLTNAPALIFPYVRSYISAVTALSGLSAINLPVMNLSSLKPLLQANISVVDE